MNVAQITSSLGAAAQPVSDSSAAGRSPLRTATTAADRKKVAAQFEAVLVRQLLSQSVGAMLGGESVAGTVYGDMMTDALSQQLTAGPGLGLGRFIEKQLTPRGTPVDRHDDLPAAASTPPLTRAHS